MDNGFLEKWMASVPFETCVRGQSHPGNTNLIGDGITEYYCFLFV